MTYHDLERDLRDGDPSLDDYPPCLPVTFWRGMLVCFLMVLAAFAGACVFLF